MLCGKIRNYAQCRYIRLKNFNRLALFRFACLCTDIPVKIRKIAETVSISMLPDL